MYIQYYSIHTYYTVKCWLKKKKILSLESSSAEKIEKIHIGVENTPRR